MSLLGLAGALLVGLAFGYSAQRGAFCMSSGLRGVVEGEWTKIKAFGMAVAVQLLLLPIVFGTGLAHPTALPLEPMTAMTGGVLFGASMRWAGGCAAGIWYKVGGGDLGALLAILGMALGATASDRNPWLRVSMQETTPPVGSWAPSPILSVAVGVILLVALACTRDGRAGAWSWRKTGLWIGMIATIAWPVSAASGRSFGLAVAPGTIGLLSSAMGRAFPDWDVLFVVGIPIGGWLAVRKVGSVGLSAPTSSVLVKRFCGGLGLGVGASIATGCTVGQGLTGLALLAPSSFVVMASIFGGNTLAALIARRPRPAGTAAPAPFKTVTRLERGRGATPAPAIAPPAAAARSSVLQAAAPETDQARNPRSRANTMA